ncbi:MAG: glycoside hydrolase family 99-like domain-containing protein [Sphingobacteriales bacterium]|nr:glycoside hydrolase family 99-like domain-containing protein [Sphingobacteriales bacterium]
MNKIKIIAHYLPQYHPIPENDTWWGKGFTEWTNVSKAQPLFKGHIQPRLPADLGFYDLRLPEVREAQAQLAIDAGVHGFCYWHYWFGNGKRLLERPFNEVLESRKPNLPFCLGWANETWSGIWHGEDKRILIEQRYDGQEDQDLHFDFLLKAFKDERYIKVNHAPLFYIYRPLQIPNIKEYLQYWDQKAITHGFNGIHFISNGYYPNFKEDGFKAFVDTVPFIPQLKTTLKNRLLRKFTNIPMVKTYKDFVHAPHFDRVLKADEYPSILPGWDNTPRSRERGIVFFGSNPDLFKLHVKKVLKQIKTQNKDGIIFLKSWNEWAEGNYMEPDQIFGMQYLNVLKEALNE